MIFFVRNTENGLIPLYYSDQFEIKKLKIGEDYKVEIKKARNIGNHKRYFALIKLTWLNLPECFDDAFPHPENLREALQIEAGYFETSVLFDGSIQKKDKSINFETLGEDEFKELFSNVLDVIFKYILPHNTKEEFEQEVINFL